MSRIGRKPIAIPDGVTVDVKPGLVSVKGPKGELTQSVSPEMTVAQGEGSGGDGADGGEDGRRRRCHRQAADRSG